MPSGATEDARPRRLIQITDPHIGADWAAADPLDTLGTVLAAIEALPFTPDGMLITGDLAADGTDEQYAELATALGGIGLPFAVLPGNHDDRAALRRHFSVGHAQAGDGPLSHALWWPPLRVLMLDTTIPGSDRGDLDADRLLWIAEMLGGDAEQESPTLLAMHHPPFHCGVPAMDRIALDPVAGDRLAALLDRHPQVIGVVAGHHHRMIATAFAGRPAAIIPSTYCQMPLDLDAIHLSPVPEPLAFAVHTLVGGRLVTHVETLAVTAAYPG